jgi:cell division protein FtsA
MVVGEVRSDGSVKILGLGQTRSAGIRRGEIVDYPQARACVKEAMLKAEDAGDVEIRSVLLSVTGNHIRGVSNRGTFRLPDGDRTITNAHVEEVREIARDLQIPREHVYLHHIVRHYIVDGQMHANSPVGLGGRTLECDFHVVHGMRSRIENSIRCVREIPIDVDEVVFAPLASAQFALERDEKERGALVIDIGAGTTDYILYEEGSVAASGCIPVGGDHITNDIHLVTGLPWAKAEKVKIEEGDASGDPARSVGSFRVPADQGFAEASISRGLLNEVIRTRLEETMDLVRQQLPENGLKNIGSGIYLTGGTSLMHGCGELFHKLFGCAIYHSEGPNVSGSHAIFKDPRYSTVVGLIRYAQVMDPDMRGGSGGLLTRLLHPFWPFGR